MEDSSDENIALRQINTSNVLQQFTDLYADQLKGTDDSYDGLKLKVNILENWVQDLTAQNKMLVTTVEELEGETLKRLKTLEASLQQRQKNSPSFTSKELLMSPWGLNRIEALTQELNAVKEQLSHKEKTVYKYNSRIEELRRIVGMGTYGHSKEFDQYPENQNSPCSTSAPTSVNNELEKTHLQLCQMKTDVAELKEKLNDADENAKHLKRDLDRSKKNAKEIQTALTAEVADKHDQILALRKEVAQLEDQLRQADMQTHFKDDIIKELRKEVKVARSKETLVEVLGIKERSLSHLEQLTEQLEQKDHAIACLKAELQHRQEHSPDTLYKVKQQVDWFTDNILQQCSKGKVSEEFKKCITTMLEELRESIECCKFGPSNPSESTKVR